MTAEAVKMKAGFNLKYLVNNIGRTGTGAEIGFQGHSYFSLGHLGGWWNHH